MVRFVRCPGLELERRKRNTCTVAIKVGFQKAERKKRKRTFAANRALCPRAKADDSFARGHAARLVVWNKSRSACIFYLMLTKRLNRFCWSGLLTRDMCV